MQMCEHKSGISVAGGSRPRVSESRDWQFVTVIGPRWVSRSLCGTSQRCTSFPFRQEGGSRAQRFVRRKKHTCGARRRVCFLQQCRKTVILRSDPWDGRSDVNRKIGLSDFAATTRIPRASRGGVRLFGFPRAVVDEMHVTGDHRMPSSPATMPPFSVASSTLCLLAWRRPGGGHAPRCYLIHLLQAYHL
ncbi:hypothetical protein K505DRAFT_121911 [Melanomma pulvis-pyrius CBS 109.77]|uniref:Uncharacterized protein n=1 Tax=Melanomma pulvis-pyrius CBS 109.77 TaxID=1314802 RepID=A0A6A6WUL1_9PLEO|nr:hypothetical protein K505DRAFT_121911 [Melanomma pulvis-pyrius CBS 109.77]